MPKYNQCHSKLPYLLRKHGIQLVAVTYVDAVRDLFPALTIEKAIQMFYDKYKLTENDIGFDSIKMLIYESTQTEKKDFNICKQCNINCNSRVK